VTESGQGEYDTCREGLSDDHQYTTNKATVGGRARSIRQVGAGRKPSGDQTVVALNVACELLLF
jgi:hypothetical protein